MLATHKGLCIIAAIAGEDLQGRGLSILDVQQAKLWRRLTFGDDTSVFQVVSQLTQDSMLAVVSKPSIMQSLDKPFDISSFGPGFE